MDLMKLQALCLCLALWQAHGFAPSSRRASSRNPSGAARHMFSGIVEDVGTVKALREKEQMVLWDGSVGKGSTTRVEGSGWLVHAKGLCATGYELEVRSPIAVDGAELGCSIAINGVCLTATNIDEASDTITFGLAPETLRVSNLRSLDETSRVNVERALPTQSRNSGHFVQGHVDNRGLIVKAWKEGDSLWLKIAAPENLMRYIVPKGFIAVDGTSLTVCETAPASIARTALARDEPAEVWSWRPMEALPHYTDGYGWFTLMLVAYTQTKVTLPSKALDSDTVAEGEVNIEVDVLAKYVERGLQGILDRVEKLEKQLYKEDS